MSSATSSAPKYQLGDLVWAKMKGFTPWPGKLVEPNNTTLKKPPGNVRSDVSHCVYFFGSNNYAWIPETSIKPYAEFKEANVKLNKSKGFKEAVQLIDDFISQGCPASLDPTVADAEPAGNGKGLPSIDEELSTIFADGKGAKAEPETKASTNSSSQKDYSRKPFTKVRKPAASSNSTAAAHSNNTNDEDAATAPPPAKKSRSTEEPVSTSAASKSAAGSAKQGARNILARTSQYLLDSNSGTNNSNELDVGTVSAKSKSIRASSLKFGFIGLGLMGQRLLKNLLNSGHAVTIWNRTPSKCKDFLKAGATKATTPADVVAAADITFSCLADPHAVKEIVFGNCGILAEMRSGKGYVEMTSIDADTSNDISEAILARGGRYLEAPCIGSGKNQAEEGNLTIIVSGDKSLFDDCNSCFQAISQHAFYLGGQVGDASKMGLVVSMLIGNLIGSLAESMALADRTGLSQKDLLEILTVSPLNCSTIISKGRAMIDGGFAT